MASSADRLSVIVPVLDDAPALGRLLPRLAVAAPSAEVIVVDGGSSDRPERLAATHRARFVLAERGRGAQLDAGADAARGDVLWFLHADVCVPDGAEDAIREALADPRVVGGAFRFRLARRNAWAPLIDGAVRFRAGVLSRPYGDQGIFARTTAYWSAGGFRSLPLFEDLDFVRRLRRLGRLAIVEASILVSARRWEHGGYLRTTLRHEALRLGHALGVSPERLARHHPPIREGTTS